MRLWSFLLLLLVLLPAWSQKRGRPKPPDIELVEVKARRDQDRVKVDALVRNCGTKPIQGLRIYFDFRAPRGMVMTRQSGGIEPEVLEPGEEAEIRVQLHDHPRAVDFVVSFEDSAGRELRAARTGPFPIE